MTTYNINIVGSLTNTAGILSGFSASNYATLPTTFNPENNTWELQIAFKTGSTIQSVEVVPIFDKVDPLGWFGLRIDIYQNKMFYFLSDGTYNSHYILNDSGQNTLQANTNYILKLSYDGTTYVGSISSDNGSTFAQDISVTSSYKMYSSTTDATKLGQRTGSEVGTTYYAGGYEIDLNYCYIKIAGATVWQGVTGTDGTRIQMRRGTASRWTTVNPVLLSGELGVETDTNKFKIGDGSTAWSNLAYQGSITGTDVTNALGYTPYNSSNPNGYTSNVGTVTSVNNTQPDANGNVTIQTGGTVDQTFDDTSTNAQSGTAVKDAFLSYSGSEISVMPNINDIVSLGQVIGDNSWSNVTYDGTKFVAISQTGYISTSTDGETWTTPVQNSDLGNNTWRGLVYDGTKFVALGSSGWISTSTDGTTWTTAIQNNNLGSNNWRGLAYGDNKFVAIAQTGYISTSLNGTDWDTATQNTDVGSHNWYRVVYGNNKFVAIGQAGWISTSTDGVNWTTGTQNAKLYYTATSGWYSLTFGNGIFIAYCNWSTYNKSFIAISKDGINWSFPIEKTGIFSTKTYYMAFGNNKFIAIGTDGYVLIANPIKNILSLMTPYIVNTDMTISGSGKYIQLSNGLIIQWGYLTSSSKSVTYPIAFPNRVVVVFQKSGYASSDSTTDTGFTEQLLTGFTMNTSGSYDGINWIAIGF